MEAITNLGAIVIGFITVVIALAAYFMAAKIKYKDIKIAAGRDIGIEIEQIKKTISITALEVSFLDKQYWLLREYHTQGLAQSKISFWFSLIFA